MGVVSTQQHRRVHGDAVEQPREGGEHPDLQRLGRAQGPGIAAPAHSIRQQAGSTLASAPRARRARSGPAWRDGWRWRRPRAATAGRCRLRRTHRGARGCRWRPPARRRVSTASSCRPPVRRRSPPRRAVRRGRRGRTESGPAPRPCRRERRPGRRPHRFGEGQPATPSPIRHRSRVQRDRRARDRRGGWPVPGSAASGRPCDRTRTARQQDRRCAASRSRGTGSRPPLAEPGRAGRRRPASADAGRPRRPASSRSAPAGDLVEGVVVGRSCASAAAASSAAAARRGPRGDAGAGPRPGVRTRPVRRSPTTGRARHRAGRRAPARARGGRRTGGRVVAAVEAAAGFVVSSSPRACQIGPGLAPAGYPPSVRLAARRCPRRRVPGWR